MKKCFLKQQYSNLGKRYFIFCPDFLLVLTFPYKNKHLKYPLPPFVLNIIWNIYILFGTQYKNSITVFVRVKWRGMSVNVLTRSCLWTRGSKLFGFAPAWKRRKKRLNRNEHSMHNMKVLNLHCPTGNLYDPFPYW